MENIFQLVKKAEQNLLHSKPIKIGKYATHDHTEKVSTIDAYINSQQTSGKMDSLGREKPFFNICLFSVYTWYKTTDIDRKHIKFRAPNSKERLKALIATIKLRLWMNKKNFGAWLNKWGLALATYGSAVSKFIEQDGKLIPSVISWDRIICDPVDFNNNIKIEKLYFTPAQLRQQPYDQEAIDEAIEAFTQSRKTLTNEPIDIRNEYIGVYEVHGNLPLYYLTGEEEDKDVYRQQMHVLFMHGKGKDFKGGIKNDTNITLYSGKEEKDPYYLSHLIEQEGRTLSIGAVESLFDAQWMVNHSAKQIKDQLDLSSKLLSQTSDEQFLGRNVMTDADTGDVLIHREGQPLTKVNNQSHDIPQISSYLEQWKLLAREITGAHESVTGQTMPSGTPYRLGMMLNTEARGLFEIMRQNKGLHLEEIIRTYILPYFKKKLKTTDEIIAVLEGEEIENFDDLSLPARLEQETMARLMNNHIPNREELMMSIEDQNNEMGNVRILKPSKDEKKTWADYFKGFEWDVEIDITGENRDKNATITSLDTLLQRMMSAPQMFTPEDIKKVFNKILDEIGTDVLSPLQFRQKGQGVSHEGTTGELPSLQSEGIADKVGMPTLTPTI